MSKHDILCNVYENACCPWIGNCECQCTCDIIAIIREDEQMKEYNRPFDEVSMLWHKRGYAAALRDAVEAVKVQSPAIWSYPLHGAERTGVWLDDAVAAIEALGGEQ